MGGYNLKLYGCMNISAWAVYNFPCNGSIDSYEVILSRKTFSLTAHVYYQLSVSQYVQWKPYFSDLTTLQLHHQSLNFPLIAKSTTPKSRNLKHQHYDSHLSATLQKVHSLVDQINKTAEDSISVYLAYAVFSLSLLKLHSCHDYCL